MVRHGIGILGYGGFRHYNLENYAQDQGLPPDHRFWNKEISGSIQSGQICR